MIDTASRAHADPGAANGHAAWPEENLPTDPLCQLVVAGVDQSRLPSNNSRYCRT
ncbi:hypothetical protein [Mycobacteroides franklinii]|uniref:hypothetical protein n=1 Tax=Mycobacteroides franklinii TaxID=948102 RepID=UPI0013F4D8F5|nr:hypothetical protein [Mycobacteroides franklinii]